MVRPTLHPVTPFLHSNSRSAPSDLNLVFHFVTLTVAFQCFVAFSPRGPWPPCCPLSPRPPFPPSPPLQSNSSVWSLDTSHLVPVHGPSLAARSTPGFPEALSLI